MDSIFTKIVKGDIPSFKIAEDDDFMAFLDINPLAEGHTLVIPKKQIDYIFNMEDEIFIGLHLFAKKVAKAIEKVIKCERIGVVVLGLEVAHAHIHLVPINEIGFIDVSKPKLKFTNEEFEKLSNNISNKLCD